MKQLSNYIISLFVVIIVLFLILPLPTFLLDVLLVINISIAILILLITMNTQDALEFSIFPSLLLVTTLFRLGLNVSSTRLILSNGGNAGSVIKAFGELITGGSIVIGVIIFLIIVLVQFIVITKGAERVAEVAARFTLDAMPGKQMAIDADLSSGLIDEQTAKKRREKIQKEADFFGAMDGATKIVKGDAIMSLIITLINFVAGLVTGMLSGMETSAVIDVYSTATIGDGLVSQLPALLISTATGMIVTRSVSDNSLNFDVLQQFKMQPRSIAATSIILAFLALMPKTPTLPLSIVAVILFVLSRRISAKLKEEALLAEEAPPPEEPQNIEEIATEEEDYYKDINNVYSLLTVEPIEMEFGYSLIPLVDESQGGLLISRVVIFRRQYAQDMGFVIPSVRLHDSAVLGTNQYIIKIRGEEVARGEILSDYFLALVPANPGGEIDGIETIEPSYGIPSRWILPENKELAEVYGYTVIDPLSVMLTHLSETIKKHSYELIDRSETIRLVEHLKHSAPELVEEAVPAVVSYGNLEKILKNLLREGIPIRDMSIILEQASESLALIRDLDMVTENVRAALSRTITRRFCEHGQLRVVTLDAEVEKQVVAALNKNEQGIFLAMSNDLMQLILTQLGEHMKTFADLGQTPILLTSQLIRVYLGRVISQFFPNVYVLAFNEITSTIQIQAIGNISMNPNKGGG